MQSGAEDRNWGRRPNWLLFQLKYSYPSIKLNLLTTFVWYLHLDSSNSTFSCSNFIFTASPRKWNISRLCMLCLTWQLQSVAEPSTWWVCWIRECYYNSSDWAVPFIWAIHKHVLCFKAYITFYNASKSGLIGKIIMWTRISGIW